MITPQIILYVIAVVFFVLDGLKIQHPNFSWTPLGFAAVVLGWIVGSL